MIQILLWNNGKRTRFKSHSPVLILREIIVLKNWPIYSKNKNESNCPTLFSKIKTR